MSEDTSERRRIGPVAALGGGVLAVLVALLFGQGDGARLVGYLVAALAAFNGVRTAVGGTARNPWVNRVAGSVAVLLAAIAAAIVTVGVPAVSSWIPVA